MSHTLHTRTTQEAHRQESESILQKGRGQVGFAVAKEDGNEKSSLENATGEKWSLRYGLSRWGRQSLCCILHEKTERQGKLCHNNLEVTL